MEKINMDEVEINNKKSRNIKNPFKYIYGKIYIPGSFRSIRRSIGIIFITISIFYGLIWVPSQQLEINRDQFELSQQSYLINIDMIRLSLTKIQNSCQVIAGNSLAAYEEQVEEGLDDEQKKQLADLFFSNCLFIEGLSIQNEN